MNTTIRWMLIHTAALLALALVLGTGSVTTAQSSTPTERPNSESLGTRYPVTIKDCCGSETTYDKAPERVITIDPNLTEMLLISSFLRPTQRLSHHA